VRKFVFVGPDWLDEDHAVCQHIFPAMPDPKNRSKSIEDKALCAKATLLDGCPPLECFDEKAARIFAANRQNAKSDVCGSCIARLYNLKDIR
jgi:hypothetical protein